MNCYPRGFLLIIFVLVVSCFAFFASPEDAFGQDYPDDRERSDKWTPFNKRLLISTYGCVPAFGVSDSECFGAPFAVVDIRWYHPNNPFRSELRGLFASSIPDLNTTVEESAGATFAYDRNSGPVPNGSPEREERSEKSGGFIPEIAGAVQDPLADIPGLYHGGMQSYTFEYSRFLNTPPVGKLEDLLNLQFFVGFGFAKATKDMSRNEVEYVTVDYERAFPTFSYGLDLGISVVQSDQIQIRFKLRGQTYMPPNRMDYMLIENIDGQRSVTPFTSSTSSFTKIDLLLGVGFLL